MGSTPGHLCRTQHTWRILRTASKLYATVLRSPQMIIAAIRCVPAVTQSQKRTQVTRHLGTALRGGLARGAAPLAKGAAVAEFDCGRLSHISGLSHATVVLLHVRQPQRV
jgi:hypothetical protein